MTDNDLLINQYLVPYHLTDKISPSQVELLVRTYNDHIHNRRPFDEYMEVLDTVIEEITDDPQTEQHRAMYEKLRHFRNQPEWMAKVSHAIATCKQYLHECENELMAMPRDDTLGPPPLHSYLRHAHAAVAAAIFYLPEDNTND